MILIPIPSSDFDPSETAIPYKVLTQAGKRITFATPDGQKAAGDFRMLTGDGLGIWKKILMARQDAIESYNQMITSPEFIRPISYSQIKETDYEAILLPGGHAPGMKVYLESQDVQKAIVSFFRANKPVAAICHGVLVVARSLAADGKSVLHDKKTTALLAKQEMAAYTMTGLWLGNYYRTYPTTVQSEVVSFLKNKDQFLTGGSTTKRDTENDPSPAFTVKDGNYLSARWPGDAYTFAKEFLKML